MELRIDLADAEPAELAALLRWLRDDEVGQQATFAAGHGPADPERMGAALEVINVVLSNGIALAGLILAIASWRESRRRPTTVRIAQGDTVVELHGSTDREIRAVVDAIWPQPRR